MGLQKHMTLKRTKLLKRPNFTIETMTKYDGLIVQHFSRYIIENQMI